MSGSEGTNRHQTYFSRERRPGYRHHMQRREHYSGDFYSDGKMYCDRVDDSHRNVYHKSDFISSHSNSNWNTNDEIDDLAEKFPRDLKLTVTCSSDGSRNVSVSQTPESPNCSDNTLASPTHVAHSEEPFQMQQDFSSFSHNSKHFVFGNSSKECSSSDRNADVLNGPIEFINSKYQGYFNEKNSKRLSKPNSRYQNKPTSHNKSSPNSEVLKEKLHQHHSDDIFADIHEQISNGSMSTEEMKAYLELCEKKLYSKIDDVDSLFNKIENLGDQT